MNKQKRTDINPEQPQDEKYEPVFDVSPDYEHPVSTGDDGYEANVQYCKRLRGKSDDIIIREFTLSDERRCAVVLVDGMCDKDGVETNVIYAARCFAEASGENKFRLMDGLLQQFSVTEYSSKDSLSKGYISALTGDALVIIEGEPSVYVFGYRSISSRSVDESPNNGAVKGPHEAFTENIRTNTALLRRRISDPNMVLEHLSVGRRSHTTVVLCYILGVTNPRLIEAARESINSVDIDMIADSGELEQLIESDPGSIFPQLDSSELPDGAAAELCSGRVVIMVNGSPQALILPATLSSLMHARDDDYQRWSYASFIKLLRWFALIISVVGPAFYVVMISFHPGMLPSNLLIISAVNRLNVPFSALVEVLLIELVLELLREASIRLPKSIGTSLSIVGGIIIGDAAISAGLISPLLVIVIGISTIAGFTIPSYSFSSAIRLVKYMVLILSSLLGLLGLAMGIVLWLSLMVSTHSFGADFTLPFSPLYKRSLYRSLFELPMRLRGRRPEYLHPVDDVRYSKT